MIFIFSSMSFYTHSFLTPHEILNFKTCIITILTCLFFVLFSMGISQKLTRIENHSFKNKHGSVFISQKITQHHFMFNKIQHQFIP